MLDLNAISALRNIFSDYQYIMTAKVFEEISPQRKYHGISAQIIIQINHIAHTNVHIKRHKDIFDDRGFKVGKLRMDRALFRFGYVFS